MMTSSGLILSFCAVALALGAPSSTIEQRDPFAWTPALAWYYDIIAQHIESARSDSTFPTPPSCDLSKAVMPVAPTPLPSPTGLKLAHVAVGRGVQNYTCAHADATTTPAPIGAVAKLYNASCIAANYPDLLQLLPNLALQYPLPSEPSANLQPPNMDLSGHHYFSTNTTPVFNMDADPAIQLGIAVAKKAANSTAPAGSPKGQNGVGDGAVAWLYLTTTNATVGDFKAVYRVSTAGGAPPKTCQSSPAVFSVEYAALYWFYS